MSEKYDVHQKEYQVQQNMVNVSEKEEVEWKIDTFKSCGSSIVTRLVAGEASVQKYIYMG